MWRLHLIKNHSLFWRREVSLYFSFCRLIQWDVMLAYDPTHWLLEIALNQKSLTCLKEKDVPFSPFFPFSSRLSQQADVMLAYDPTHTRQSWRKGKHTSSGISQWCQIRICSPSALCSVSVKYVNSSSSLSGWPWDIQVDQNRWRTYRLWCLVKPLRCHCEAHALSLCSCWCRTCLTMLQLPWGSFLETWWLERSIEDGWLLKPGGIYFYVSDNASNHMWSEISFLKWSTHHSH